MYPGEPGLRPTSLSRSSAPESSEAPAPAAAPAPAIQSQSSSVLVGPACPDGARGGSRHSTSRGVAESGPAQTRRRGRSSSPPAGLSLPRRLGALRFTAARTLCLVHSRGAARSTAAQAARVVTLAVLPQNWSKPPQKQMHCWRSTSASSALPLPLTRTALSPNSTRFWMEACRPGVTPGKPWGLAWGSILKKALHNGPDSGQLSCRNPRYAACWRSLCLRAAVPDD